CRACCAPRGGPLGCEGGSGDVPTGGAQLAAWFPQASSAFATGRHAEVARRSGSRAGTHGGLSVVRPGEGRSQRDLALPGKSKSLTCVLSERRDSVCPGGHLLGELMRERREKTTVAVAGFVKVTALQVLSR